MGRTEGPVSAFLWISKTVSLRSAEDRRIGALGAERILQTKLQSNFVCERSRSESDPAMRPIRSMTPTLSKEMVFCKFVPQRRSLWLLVPFCADKKELAARRDLAGGGGQDGLKRMQGPRPCWAKRQRRPDRAASAVVSAIFSAAYLPTISAVSRAIISTPAGRARRGAPSFQCSGEQSPPSAKIFAPQKCLYGASAPPRAAGPQS